MVQKVLITEQNPRNLFCEDLQLCIQGCHETRMRVQEQINESFVDSSPGWYASGFVMDNYTLYES